MIVALATAALPAVAAIPRAERDVLTALYAHAGGDNWTHADAWNGAPGTECTWYGITCDMSNSHVTGIDLRENALTGTLSDITRLTELVHFDVSQNALTGPLPSFAGMRKLDYFSVAFNGLAGDLPVFAGVNALTTYLVNNNHFTGRIPSFANVPNLAVIGVDHNALTGSIPALAMLSHLDTLFANDNDLTGLLPPLPVRATLRILNVAGNHLTGPLPMAPPGPAIVWLCPNSFTQIPDAGWDVLVADSPWYVGCDGAHLNLNQFGVTGSWYDPDRSGQGVVLSSMPHIDAQGHGFVFGGWFTFTPQASTEPAAPHWFSIQGPVGTDSQATLELYETTGGRFNDAPAPTTRPVGSALLYLSDCQHGVMQYNFDDNRVPDGDFYITRLMPSETCTLTGNHPPPAHNSLLSGAWYDPQHSGQGFVFDVASSTGTLFGAWHTFAPDTTDGASDVNQRWYSLQAAFLSPDATTFDNVAIYAPTLGVFGGAATGPVAEVGSARLEFEGCSELTIDYTFDAPDTRAGTLHLVRLGPAPAGCE